MLADIRLTSIYLAILLTLLMAPLNSAGIHLGESRLARISDDFDRQDAYPDADYSDIEKRENIMSIIKPPKDIYENPESLRNYLRQLNEYIAIIGRPRFADY